MRVFVLILIRIREQEEEEDKVFNHLSSKQLKNNQSLIKSCRSHHSHRSHQIQQHLYPMKNKSIPADKLLIKENLIKVYIDVEIALELTESNNKIIHQHLK